jgi:hypothetical protein
MQLRRSLLLVASLTQAACVDDKGTTNDTTASTDTGTGTGEPQTAGTTDEPTSDPVTGTDTPGTTTTGGSSTGTPDPTTDEPATTEAETTTGVPGLSFAADVYPVLNPPASCDCHTPGAGGLHMGDVDTAYMELVGVPANGGPVSRVEPGDHLASYIWYKITGTQADIGGGGSTMPLGAPMLPQSTIDLIAQWIDEGAAP